MFVEIRRITAEELPDWADASLRDYAQRSDPLLTYWFGEELIAIVGFIPFGILSSTAYLWMQETPATFQHPTAVARQGLLTLREIRKRYTRIYGECAVGSRSIRWLRWLGARFAEPVGRSVPFLIGDYQ